jgi:murein DD-endopeptidase MepM/ murein hydrolase activator NlpD
MRRAVVETQNEISERKAELDQASRRLRKLETKTKRIQDRQRARYRLLAKNEKQAKQIRSKQLAARRTLQRRISGFVRQAQAQAARRSSGLGGSGNGRFVWPTRGTVTQGYGCTGFGLEPPRGSCANFHDGIDIANAAGTPIRAAANGVVAFIGYRPDGAFVVVMGHAGGYETVYGHMLPTYPVRVGQFVKQGQVIGKMGSTGYSTGNHLHWEVSRGFRTSNPRLYV